MSAVEPYIGAHGGIHFWPAYSNRDQIEADTEPGYSWSVLLGLTVHGDEIVGAMPFFEPVMSNRFNLRVELEGAQRLSAIHGVNQGAAQLTADGETLEVWSGQFNLWPSFEVVQNWHWYAGGGGGVSWINGLGGRAVVSSYQVGTGVLVDVPFEHVTASFDFGWRSFFASSTQFDNNLLDFDSHGCAIGLLFRF